MIEYVADSELSLRRGGSVSSGRIVPIGQESNCQNALHSHRLDSPGTTNLPCFFLQC